jgi:hypothetical protein
MGDNGAARLGADLDRVREWDVRVCRRHGAVSTLAGLHGAETGTADAVGLPGAHADQDAVLHEHHRVRLHVLAHRPGEPQVIQLRLRGLTVAGHLERHVLRHIGGLHKHGSADAARLDALALRVADRSLDDA